MSFAVFVLEMRERFLSIFLTSRFNLNMIFSAVPTIMLLCNRMQVECWKLYLFPHYHVNPIFEYFNVTIHFFPLNFFSIMPVGDIIN